MYFYRPPPGRRPNGTSAIPSPLVFALATIRFSFLLFSFQDKMLRSALRQSSRAVGAVSASSRAATVSLRTTSEKSSLYRTRLQWTHCTCETSPEISICLHIILIQGLLTSESSQARKATPTVFAATSNQARSYAVDAKASPTEVSSILEQRIRGVQEEAGLAETGRVLSVGYI